MRRALTLTLTLTLTPTLTLTLSAWHRYRYGGGILCCASTTLPPLSPPLYGRYGGDILCCADGVQLLDAHQAVPTPLDTWRLKYRFYIDAPLDAQVCVYVCSCGGRWSVVGPG